MKGSFHHVSQALYKARSNSRLRYSQAELASILGCDPQFISNIERAKCGIPAKLILKTSKILEVPFETFMDAMVSDYATSLVSAIAASQPMTEVDV